MYYYFLLPPSWLISLLLFQRYLLPHLYDYVISANDSGSDFNVPAEIIMERAKRSRLQTRLSAAIMKQTLSIANCAS